MTIIISVILSMVVFKVNGWTTDALAKNEISQLEALRLVWGACFLSWMGGLITGLNIYQPSSTSDEEKSLSSNQYNRRSYGATAI